MTQKRIARKSLRGSSARRVHAKRRSRQPQRPVSDGKPPRHAPEPEQPAAETARPDRRAFPIVGIGASAGGLEPELPPIIAEPTQLHQALLNLCVNARDSMPRGGALTIRTASSSRDQVRERFPEASAERYVAVSVADTGAGIDEETRRRLFEPFFTTKERGSGLGLAVVYGIVNSHRG